MMSHQDAANDWETRAEDEVNVNIVSPSVGVPDNLVLKNVKLTETVLDLKRRLNNVLGSHPTPSDQRLIYRGKPLSNDSDILKKIFRFDLCGSTKTPSIHLVLPPSAPATTGPSLDNQSRNPSSFFNLANFSNSIPRFSLSHRRQYASGPPTNASATVTNENELPYGNTTEPRSHLGGTVHNQTNVIHLPGTIAPGSSLEANAESQAVAETVFLPAETQSQDIPASVETINSEQTYRADLARKVFTFESRVRAGDAVPVETLTQLQHEISQLRREQIGSQRTLNDEIPEFLLGRLQTLIHNASSLADQTSEPAHVEHPSPSPDGSAGHAPQQERLFPPQTSVYLLMGPNGYQGLLTPPFVGNAPNTLQFNSLVPQHTIYTPHTQLGSNAGLHPNPSYPTMNAYPIAPQLQPPRFNRLAAAQRYRQMNARADARRRPRHVQVAQINVSSWFRRTWMFFRLYLLAYLISEDHTFLRYGLVALAVLASLASDTEYPQMIYNAVIGPVHRHIEYLIPLDNNPGGQGTEAGESGTTNAATDSVEPRQQQQRRESDNRTNAPESLLDSWHRSIALFMATLIPGIGEPHIAARLAAREAAARRWLETQRREEESRQQEQRRQQEQSEESNNEVPQQSGACDVREALVDSGATTGRELTDGSNQTRSRHGGIAEAPNA